MTTSADLSWTVNELADQLRAENDQNADAAGGTVPNRVAKIIRERGRSIWYRQDWLFRKKSATLSVIAGASSVDLPADFKKLDGNTMRITGTAPIKLLWTQDPSAFEDAKSLFGSTASAAYPRIALLYFSAGTYKAKLWPAADAAYDYPYWYMTKSPWCGSSPISDTTRLSPTYWPEEFDDAWYKLCAWHVFSRFRADDAWKGFKSDFEQCILALDIVNNSMIVSDPGPIEDAMGDFGSTAVGLMARLPGGTFKWYGSI